MPLLSYNQHKLIVSFPPLDLHATIILQPTQDVEQQPERAVSQVERLEGERITRPRHDQDELEGDVTRRVPHKRSEVLAQYHAHDPADRGRGATPGPRVESRRQCGSESRQRYVNEHRPGDVSRLVQTADDRVGDSATEDAARERTAVRDRLLARTERLAERALRAAASTAGEARVGALQPHGQCLRIS